MLSAIDAERREPSPGARISTAWLVVVLLLPVALLNYMDRQMLASMKSSIVSDIRSISTDAQWGMVLAFFKWTYAFLSPCGGFVADRLGRRVVIISSLFVWSAVTCLTGMVSSYEGLLATRALMGISEAFYIPAALALISDCHFGATRSKAVGIHQIGIYLGVIVGGFAGYVADAPGLGWRWAFFAAGIAGMLYSLPLIFLLKAPERSGRHNHRAGASRSDIVELISNPSFRLLVAYFTLPAIAGWVVRDWMPTILKESFQIGQGLAGVSATLYWQVAAIVGAILGGAIADRWMQRSHRGRIHASAIGMVLIVPAMLGIGYSTSTGFLWVAILFLILFGLGWGFFDCNNMPILCQIARPHLRATGYGIMNFVSISGGAFADWGFGRMRDLKVPLPVLFGLIASAGIVSILLVLKIQPRNLESNSTGRDSSDSNDDSRTLSP